MTLVFDGDRLAWDKMQGLLPVVVQDARTLQVLMLGYMNREALTKTLATGQVTFWSRSKDRLWTKGETSGNYLNLVDIKEDCDGDALLITAEPKGATCHVGTPSCFGEALAPGLGFLGRLEQVIEDRYVKRPEGSYTTKLFAAGIDRMAQKVGEEGVEVVIAAKNSDDSALAGEAADLLYHLMVLLRGRALSLAKVVDVLRQRN